MKGLLKNIVLVFGVFCLFLTFGCKDSINGFSGEEYGSLRVYASEHSSGSSASGTSSDSVSENSVSESSSSRAVYTDDIKSAVVTISGFDSKGEKFTKSSGTVSVSGGKGSGIIIEDIPVSKNVCVKVQAFSDSAAGSKIDGIVLYAKTDIATGPNNSVLATWETSRIGCVYDALISGGTNTSLFSADDIEKIENAVSSSTHASLIDASKIASDWKSASLKSADSYILESGSVSVSAENCSGAIIQISDPSSKISSALTSDSENLTINNVAPGTWNVYAVKNGTVLASGTVKVTSGGSASVSLAVEAAFDGIKVLVAKNLNYPMIYYWNCSDATAYPTKTWPGIQMKESGNDYYYEFKGVSSVSILITNSNGDKLYKEDMVLTKKGTYRVAKNGAESVSLVPTKPVITLPGETVYLGGKFTVIISSDMALTSATAVVSTGSTTGNSGSTTSTKTLSVGSNTFSVDEFTTSAGTLTISVSATNSAGTETASKTISVIEKTANTIVSDWNELRIYQVMVASFQDGDPSIGYTQMWGPNGHTKGGDLQGIINAIPYIKKLGCNALWMTPIFPSDTSDGKLNATGYFACDYFSIDPNFGTMSKFDELVELCHDNGIAVILDGVFGHNAASKGGSIGSVPNVNGVQKPGVSPSGSNPVDYANNSNSLKYYSDVARYWITEHKIDGWRFDQCYQLAFGEHALGTTSDNCNTGGHNYWYDIRKVVEEAAASNGKKGVDWGTLGYMVGEHWNGDASVIQNGTVKPGNSSGYGLNSCFDFPAYYKVVQGFAQEYKGTTTGNITTGLSYLYKTYSEKGYSCKEDDGTYETYYPNFMLSNHDLFRIGDLINQKHNDGFESDNYAKRNMVLLAAQAAYSGPITIYYGDEIADHNATTSNGWGEDNVARSSGKITGFSTREQKVHDWTQKCLSARAEHEALWNGTNTQIKGDSDFYVAKKTGGGETIYIAFNYNSSSSKSFSASGTDLLSGTKYSGTVTVPALSAVYVLAD